MSAGDACIYTFARSNYSQAHIVAAPALASTAQCFILAVSDRITDLELLSNEQSVKCAVQCRGEGWRGRT